MTPEEEITKIKKLLDNIGIPSTDGSGVYSTLGRVSLLAEKALQQPLAVDETHCDCKDEAFINDETPGCCGNCGKPFRH